MKAAITTLGVVLTLALGTVATRASQELVRRALPEVVLTGCVVPGLTSTVLIFDNAKKDPNSTVEKGQRYLLSSAVKDIDLRNHLHHSVRITGDVDMRVSAMPVLDPAKDERTLPRLIVKSVTKVSDKCSAVIAQ